MGWDDLWVLRRYHCRLRLLLVPWSSARLTPWFSKRMNLLSLYAPDWLPPQARQDDFQRLDRDGWFAFPGPMPAERYRQAVEETRRYYAPSLAHLHITHIPDQALRVLLALCRKEAMLVLLMLMPESTQFMCCLPLAGFPARL